MNKRIRLDKYLSDMEIGTRSQVKQYIKKKQVQVNGTYPSGVEQKVMPDIDVITFRGQNITYVKYKYFLFYKPKGCVSAVTDNYHKTVLDYFENDKKNGLFPVGRLDIDTEGLLLLTNNGDFAHNLLSPKKHVPKVYFAKVSGKVTEEDVICFSKGVDIGEEKLTLPAELKILSRSEITRNQVILPKSEVEQNQILWISEIELTITEGKFHQVKRMFEAVGKKVLYLKRISIGDLKLDETLNPGEYRALTEEELKKLL
ncbi:MAG: rRNA pseudouridine synthase [Lachnospiraceae bacterium]